MELCFELIFGSCVRLLSIFRDIFVQRLQWLWNSVAAHFRELCLTAVDFLRHLRSKTSMAMELCRSSFSGAATFFATSSNKNFNGYGTLSELIFGSCVWLLSIFHAIFVQNTSMAMELCLSSFSGALSDCCRFSATFSVKEFYGYGTLSSFSEAGTTGIYNTDFENKNYVWENGVFCLSFVLVNSWKADSYRVIKLIQAETIFKSPCNLWRSLLGNKKLYFAWKEKICLSELVLNTADSRTLFCSFFFRDLSATAPVYLYFLSQNSRRDFQFWLSKSVLWRWSAINMAKYLPFVEFSGTERLFSGTNEANGQSSSNCGQLS